MPYSSQSVGNSNAQHLHDGAELNQMADNNLLQLIQLNESGALKVCNITVPHVTSQFAVRWQLPHMQSVIAFNTNTNSLK